MYFWRVAEEIVDNSLDIAAEEVCGLALACRSRVFSRWLEYENILWELVWNKPNQNGTWKNQIICGTTSLCWKCAGDQIWFNNSIQKIWYTRFPLWPISRRWHDRTYDTALGSNVRRSSPILQFWSIFKRKWRCNNYKIEFPATFGAGFELTCRENEQLKYSI